MGLDRSYIGAEGYQIEMHVMAQVGGWIDASGNTYILKQLEMQTHANSCLALGGTGSADHEQTEQRVSSVLEIAL